MTEQELTQLEAQHDLAEKLQHPDPDPSDLPAIIPPELLQQEQTALHILRSSLTLDDMIERQKIRMEADLQAWTLSIAALEAKRKAWREMVKAWMERNDVKKLQTPWFTASLGKPRTKIVVDDERAAIAACIEIGYGKAVRIKTSLVKSEFDAIYNARPANFDGIAHEETGEPTLLVRRKP